MICRMIEGLLVTIVGGFIVEVLKLLFLGKKKSCMRSFEEQSYSQPEQKKQNKNQFN